MKPIKKETLLEFLENFRKKEDVKTVHIMMEATKAKETYASTLYGPDLKLDDNDKRPRAQPKPFRSAHTPSPEAKSNKPGVADIVGSEVVKLDPYSEEELKFPEPRRRKKKEEPVLVDETKKDSKEIADPEKVDDTQQQQDKLDKLSKSFIWEDEFTDPEKRAILSIPKDMWQPFFKRELLLSEEDLISAVEQKDMSKEVRCIDENMQVVYVPFIMLNKYYDVLGTHDININGKKYPVVKAVPKIYADDVMAVNYKDNKVLSKRKKQGTYAFELTESSPFFSVFTKESYDTGYGKIDSILKQLKDQPKEEKKKAPAKPRKKRTKKEETK